MASKEYSGAYGIDEEALLEKIKKISMSKGWLGGLNSWNTTNTWPGR